MTDKVMIYADMLNIALYTIRNVQSRNPFVKARDKSSYFEAELLQAQTTKLNLLKKYAKSKIGYKIVYEWKAAMARFKITETTK